MASDTDTARGCSYCGDDITTGESFHWHRVRENKFIHAACLAGHLANKSATDTERIMLQSWGDEEVA